MTGVKNDQPRNYRECENRLPEIGKSRGSRIAYVE